MTMRVSREESFRELSVGVRQHKYSPLKITSEQQG